MRLFRIFKTLRPSAVWSWRKMVRIRPAKYSIAYGCDTELIKFFVAWSFPIEIRGIWQGLCYWAIEKIMWRNYQFMLLKIVKLLLNHVSSGCWHPSGRNTKILFLKNNDYSWAWHKSGGRALFDIRVIILYNM